MLDFRSLKQGAFMTSVFQQEIQQGIPSSLPSPQSLDESVSHAPTRKKILNEDETKLALKNALRYFPEKFHEELRAEFEKELETFGRIYMYRFRPQYEMKARPLDEYPHKMTIKIEKK